MDKLLGSGELLGQNGTKTPVSALSSKEVVGLYFSAHWCVLLVFSRELPQRDGRCGMDHAKVKVISCLRGPSRISRPLYPTPRERFSAYAKACG